jgi:hypothetical protein
MPIISPSSTGGGGGALAQISNQTLGGAAATIDFPGIAGTFNHLLLVLAARGDTAATAVVVNLQFNGDSGANYDIQRVTTAAAAAGGNEAFGGTSARVGSIAAASAAAGLSGSLYIFIPGYAGAVLHKTFISNSGWKIGVASGNIAIEEVTGHWRNTAAVTRVTLLAAAGNFIAGSQATLYGLT